MENGLSLGSHHFETHTHTHTHAHTHTHSHTHTLRHFDHVDGPLPARAACTMQVLLILKQAYCRKHTVTCLFRSQNLSPAVAHMISQAAAGEMGEEMRERVFVIIIRVCYIQCCDFTP
jgi:hypothetical protein